jgi:NADH-quinone oxidoreductase subunit L
MGLAAVSQFAAVTHEAEHAHLLAGGAALLLSLGGFAVAWMFHSKGLFLAADKSGQPRPVRRFLQERWFFDQLYDALFVKPTVGTAMAASAFDKQPTDGKTSAEAFDLGTLDGLLNAAGDAVAATGNRVREANHGRLRNYVLVLGLTAVGLLGILSYLIK